jgi:hypothetical protein
MTFLKSKKGFHCTYGRTDRNSACSTETIYTAAGYRAAYLQCHYAFLKAEGEKGDLSSKLLKKKKTEIQKNMDALTDFQKQSEKLKKQKLKAMRSNSGGATHKARYLDENAS